MKNETPGWRLKFWAETVGCSLLGLLCAALPFVIFVGCVHQAPLQGYLWPQKEIHPPASILASAFPRPAVTASGDIPVKLRQVSQTKRATRSTAQAVTVQDAPIAPLDTNRPPPGFVRLSWAHNRTNGSFEVWSARTVTLPAWNLKTNTPAKAILFPMLAAQEFYRVRYRDTDGTVSSWAVTGP